MWVNLISKELKNKTEFIPVDPKHFQYGMVLKIILI